MEERIAECAKRIFTLLVHAHEINILRVSEELGESAGQTDTLRAERKPNFYFADVRTGKSNNHSAGRRSCQWSLFRCELFV